MDHVTELVRVGQENLAALMQQDRDKPAD